ncbi:hypothetical protein ACQEU5_25280 [Marinactinospora thermotolerans]|uniref:hypothetical protein n=1 Tax=Marinactinospora thermotolerans TaxID=531310 RepID=UPI003D9398CB
MARKPKPKTTAPGDVSLPPGVLAALGQDPVKKEKEGRRFKSEGAVAVVRRVLAAALRPGPDSIRRVLAAQFYPWKVGATILAAGVVASQIAAISTTHALATAIATGAGTWAALRLLRTVAARRHQATRLASEWAEVDPAHARVCAGAAGVWLIAIILIQPASFAAWWWSGLIGLLALLALGSRFWAHHRVPRAIPAPEDQAAAAPPPPGEHPIARKWRTRIGQSGGCLPGSRLSDITAQPYGVHGRLHLVGGRQSIHSARNAISLIATALGVSEADVLIEPVEPTEDNPKPDSAILDIKIVTTGQISQPVPLEAGRLVIDGDEVRIRMGRYADGDGDALYKMYTTDSMWSGFVAGSTGSGKSGLIDALALGAWEHGATIVIYLDPKNGGSSPRIFDRAHWAIPNDPPTWDALLAGLIELVEARGLENSARLKTSGFAPSRERPGVLVIVDECHAVINAQNAYLWGRVAREGRAAGVALIMASQIYSLDSFGGDDAVRANVTAGNTIALRVSRNQSSMIADIALDPSVLPKIPGVALSAEGRDVAFRAAWAPHEVTAALMDAALQRAVTELDPIAAGALDAGSGGLYSRRHEIAAQQIADAEERLRSYEAGRAPAARPAGAPQIALANQGVAPSIEIPEIDPDLLTDRDLGLGILAAATRDPHEELLARWSGPARAVLSALIEGGTLRRGQIEERVMGAEQCSRATVSRALDDLAEAGVIQALPGRRGWQLAA